jgi:hypothetical protein
MKRAKTPKKNWASHKNNWYDDAQLSEERKKKSNEKPKPNTGGHARPFWKDIQNLKWQKVKKQAQVILSLEIH